MQIGSAYLHCPEAKISKMHRTALKSSSDAGTVLTNLMTGRPARGSGNCDRRAIGRRRIILIVPPARMSEMKDKVAVI